MYIDYGKAKGLGILPARVYKNRMEIKNCVGLDVKGRFAIAHVMRDKRTPLIKGDEIVSCKLRGKISYRKIKDEPAS